MQSNLNIDDQFERIISRISEHIIKHYNISIKYFSADQWYDLGISQEIKLNLSNEDLSVGVASLNKNIIMPVSANGELVCVVKLVNGTDLNARQIQDIMELVDGIIGGSVSLVNRLNALEKEKVAKENDLINTGISDTHFALNSNVIPLNHFTHLKKEVVQEKEIEKDLFTVDTPIFIHAKSHEQIYKIGHEIYAHSNKVACLRLKDIAAQNDLTPELLNELGSVCLLIEEISTLSQESIDVLTEYLLARKQITNDGIQFVFGSIISASQLLNSKKITLNFYRLISGLRLSHQEENLTQKQLNIYVQSLMNSQKDLHVMTLLSQIGVTAFNMDDLI